MLLRRAAERPQCVLQTFGQGRETFAAEHDVSVLEAGEDEPEVIEPMIERLPSDGDAETAGVSEVGQPQPARLMLLAEDHVLLRSVKRPPGQDAPLQRAADVGMEVGDVGAIPRARRSPACRARPSGSARPRRPSKARAGPAVAGLSAPSWPRAGADRPRSDTRWQSKTPSWPRRSRGKAFFDNSCKASSGGR